MHQPMSCLACQVIILVTLYMSTHMYNFVIMPTPQTISYHSISSSNHYPTSPSTRHPVGLPMSKLVDTVPYFALARQHSETQSLDAACPLDKVM